MGEQSHERKLNAAVALLILAACLLFMYEAGCLFIVAGDDFIPPIPEMVNDLSCSIERGKDGYWKTTAVAKYLNHEKFQREPWTKVLGIDDSEVKGAKRCHRWRLAVQKVQLQIEKEKKKHENHQIPVIRYGDPVFAVR